MSRFVLALTAAAAVAACGDGGTVSPSDILGSTWRLVSLQEGSGAPILVEDASRYTLQFGSDGRILVRSDCNSCGGPYSLRGSSLDVGPLACTRAFCGEASLDARYTATLDRAESVAVNDNEMTIQGGSVVLRLRR